MISVGKKKKYLKKLRNSEIGFRGDWLRFRETKQRAGSRVREMDRLMMIMN